MWPETRIIVSEAHRLCREMNETYGQRVTVRQIYYNLFSKGIIQLTEKDYRRVCRILTEARKRGYIPFGWIEDRSRSPLWAMLYEDVSQFIGTMINKYKLNMLYEDVSQFIGTMINKYKLNTWKNQENFVIILVEKEALAPIIWDIAKEYNVFVFPTKGFSSWSMFVEDIKELAEYFGKGKRLIVLVLSDLDLSGKHIKKDYENKFRFMAKELGFQEPYIIEKIAVTEEQVKKYDLPPMQKKYRGQGVLDIWELESLDPATLRSIVRESIEKYVDLEQLREDQQIEKEEKETLLNLIVTLRSS